MPSVKSAACSIVPYSLPALPESAAEKILGGNFLRFVGGEPKPLVRAAALEGAKWVETILQNPRYAAKRALAGELLKKLEMSV